MAWMKQLVLNVNRKIGTNLVIFLLVIGFVGFAWQALRPLVFNADLYDFNSHYLASYATQHGSDPYDLANLEALAKELGIRKVTIFRYPPFWILLLSPLGALPYPVAVMTWRLLNLALIVVALWLTAKTLCLTLDGKTALVIGALLFNYDPLIYNLAIGNTNLVILVLLIGVALAWTRERHGLSGALLGLAASIKITPVVFIAYFVWKKNFRLVFAALAAILVSAGIGFLVLGERMSRTFVEVLTTFASEDNAWIGNQSWRGFLDRIFVGDEFVHAAYPNAELDHWLYYGGVALIALITALVLFRSRRTQAVHLEFAFGLLAYYIVAPTTWVHHLVWMIYSLIALALACLEREEILPAIFFALGYALIAFTLDYRNEAIFQFPQSLWISTKFYGLLILYAVNAWLLIKPVQGVSAPS